MLCLMAVLGFAATSVVPPSAECPRGARYLSTAENAPGACSVAFDGDAIVVCTPERLVAGEASAEQVLRWRASGSADWIRTGVAFAAAVDASDRGEVVVADAGGEVVLISADGTAKRWGRGALGSPSGICFGPDWIAVADRRLGEVVLYSRDARELARLGAGSMREPRGLCAARDGTLFVADRLADCVWRFEPGPAGVPAGEGKAIGTRGANPGQFRAPMDVAVIDSAHGRCLAVADELNHRICLLRDDGTDAGFFGMHSLLPRQGEGRIHYPCGVAVTPSGDRIAVAEAFEDRVQLFELNDETDAVDPAATSPPFISSHFGSESACSDDLLAVIDVETQGVALLDARHTPPLHMAIVGGSGACPNRFTEISAVGIEPGAARLWVADSGRAVVETFAIAWDKAKPPTVDMFMSRLARSFDLGHFAARVDWSGLARERAVPVVSDIAFHPSAPQVVHLLDEANRCVIEADRSLARGVARPLPPEARAPAELAVAADGRIAVCDPIARAVFVRSAGGEWTSLFELGGMAFVRPSGVIFDGADRLVVSDRGLDACIAAGPDGAWHRVGERGVLDEQFFSPESIVRSEKGIIVIDRGNHRFQRFGDGFTWNLTGSLGKYFDRKRRGSPGAAPASTPESRKPGGGVE